MIRKKGYEQLWKKAYKAAYRDVYEYFRNRLYPEIPKSELSIIQKGMIEKWVEKKKRKVPTYDNHYSFEDMSKIVESGLLESPRRKRKKVKSRKY